MIEQGQQILAFLFLRHLYSSANLQEWLALAVHALREETTVTCGSGYRDGPWEGFGSCQTCVQQAFGQAFPLQSARQIRLQLSQAGNQHSCDTHVTNWDCRSCLVPHQGKWYSRKRHVDIVRFRGGSGLSDGSGVAGSWAQKQRRSMAFLHSGGRASGIFGGPTNSKTAMYMKSYMYIVTFYYLYIILNRYAYFVGKWLKLKTNIFAKRLINSKQRQVDPPMDFTHQRGIHISIVYTVATLNLHF